MALRPVYVGVGECTCKRLDERLYQIPNTALVTAPVCQACLTERGFVVPEPRTASDVVSVDGKLLWRPDTTTDASADVQMDLGHGHFFAVVVDHNDQLVGWVHTHTDARNVNSMLCQSFCAVRPLNGSPVHQVVCVEPLTLQPSLKCRMCGAHGNVTNGKWEPLP